MAESIIIPQFPPDLSGYASKSHSHSDYALKSHTHSQYLTSHQSLSGYATQSWVTNNFAPKGSGGGNTGGSGGSYTDLTFNVKAEYQGSITFDKTQASAGFTIASAECISVTGSTGNQGSSGIVNLPVTIVGGNISHPSGATLVMSVPGYSDDGHSGSIGIHVWYTGSVVYITSYSYKSYYPAPYPNSTNANITIRCYR